ncbi:unnamed protein product, partial [Vitis vinifera]|uniref:Uncharacterized protein n=1 Tax=Vitis vinifera TaxID=29760 RepID=D7SRR1_VITVI
MASISAVQTTVSVLPFPGLNMKVFQWTTLSGLNEVEVQVTIRKNTDPGQSYGVFFNAATTICFSVSLTICLQCLQG